MTRIAATGTGAEKASFERNQLSPTTPLPRDPRADRPSVDAFERSPTARMGVAVPRARWALVAFVAFACGLFERARGEWTDVTDASSTRRGNSGAYGYAYSMRHDGGRYVMGYQEGTRVDFIPEREATGAPATVSPPVPLTAGTDSWGHAVDVGASWMIVGEPAWTSNPSQPPEGRAVMYNLASFEATQMSYVLTPSGSRTQCGSKVRTVNDYALVKCDNAGTDSTIHIFEFSTAIPPALWVETQVIETTGFDSVDMISQNTGTVFFAFGASEANTHGEVVIYKRDGSVIGQQNSWSELQNIPSPSNTAAASSVVSFGAYVHMHSYDIFVGAPNDDDGGLGSSVYVYTWSVSAGEYELADRLTVPSGHLIGTHGDIAGSNGLLAASYTTTSNELGIYVFKRDYSTGVWGDFLRIPKPDECGDGAFGSTGDGAIVLENVFLSVGCNRAENSQLSPQPDYVPGQQPGSVLTYDVMNTGSGSTGDGAATDADAATADDATDDDDDLSKGEIAGIAIGCIAFAVIVLIICRRFICPRESPWTQQQPQQQPQVAVVRQLNRSIGGLSRVESDKALARVDGLESI